MHDVNILVYAHRPDMPQHSAYREQFAQELSGEQSYAVSDFVINGFVRVVTNPRVFRIDPTPVKAALDFADQVRHQPHAIVVNPGPRHWSIFTRLCEETGLAGDELPDVYLAALAIEHGCEFVTADKGFRRFRGLRVSQFAK